MAKKENEDGKLGAIDKSQACEVRELAPQEIKRAVELLVDCMAKNNIDEFHAQAAMLAIVQAQHEAGIFVDFHRNDQLAN